MANQNTTEEFEEVRCNGCHRLLLRVSGVTKGKIETKCRNCKRLCRINLPISANPHKINFEKAA